jgi:ribosomal protein S27AE
MAIKPKPYKLVCNKCGYTKIVSLDSDVLPSINSIPICPKCGASMTKSSLDIVDKIKGLFYA